MLDLYGADAWSATSSPCSELFEDVDLSSSGSDLEDSYINDFSIDFASYLDPAALNTSPEDLNKYLPPKESNSVIEVQPYFCKVDRGYMPPVRSMPIKQEHKATVIPPKPVMSYRKNKMPAVAEREPVQQVPAKLPSMASQLKAPSARSYRKLCASKKSSLDKDSDDYRQKRERNNVAVRKSRYKSKQKFIETQTKVEELTEENERLHMKVDILTKELNVLRGLFSNPSVFKDHAFAKSLLAQSLPQHAQ
jgi:hypothetical protein